MSGYRKADDSLMQKIFDETPSPPTPKQLYIYLRNVFGDSVIIINSTLFVKHDCADPFKILSETKFRFI